MKTVLVFAPSIDLLQFFKISINLFVGPVYKRVIKH